MSASITGLPREPRLQALRYWIAEHRLPVFGWGAILAMLVGAVVAWQLGVVNPSPIAEPRTSFGTEGANLIEKGSVGPGVEVGAVGDGETRTYILREKGAVGPQPAVIFLHGFGSSIIVGYEPWLEHLAKSGVTVIFPSWQQPPFPTDGSQNPRTNMFQGVQLAAKAVPIIPDQVAAVGLSAGGALAFDYAALATELDVPKARLVLSIYPGRAFPGQKDPILPIPPVGGMEPDAKVVTMVSRKDEEVGTFWGKQQYDALATRPDDLRELVYVKTPGLGDHYAPGDTDAKARRVFWKRLDNLMTTHLGAKLDLDADLRESVRADRRVQRNLKEQSMFRQRAESGE
ncbi:MAG: hypothetical protein JHD16_07430 [Solirubrobacteraceae bacterium]|nr:hypothetical protein [Solirubrobacteraceae bacterium]